MSTHLFNNIPSWLTKPINLQNVITNQFASLKDVSSFISLPEKSSFLSGLRQALFWKKRLSPSTSAFTVIFSLLGPQGLILPNVAEVCQALRNICNTLNISEIYKATNSHFIGFTFNNSSDASKFRSTFTYFSDSIVIHAPISSPLVHHFKLLWLPPAFPDARIHHFLAKHSAHHSFTRDLILTGSNSHLPTNSVTGTIELLPNADVNNLPHLIPLPPPHIGNAFFILSGRPSFCLRCSQIGHIRRSCPTPRCSSCHHFHSSSAPCSSTDLTLDSALLYTYFFDDPDLTSTSSSASSHTPACFTVTASNFSSAILTTPSPSHTMATPCLPASTNTPSHSEQPDDSSLVNKRVTRSMTSGLHLHNPSDNNDAASRSMTSGQHLHNPSNNNETTFHVTSISSSNTFSILLDETDITSDLSKVPSSANFYNSKASSPSDHISQDAPLESSTSLTICKPSTCLSSNSDLQAKDPPQLHTSHGCTFSPLDDDMVSHSTKPSQTLPDNTSFQHSTPLDIDSNLPFPSNSSIPLNVTNSPSTQLPKRKRLLSNSTSSSSSSLQDNLTSISPTSSSWSMEVEATLPFDDTSRAPHLHHGLSPPTHPSTTSPIPTHDAPRSSSMLECIKCLANNPASFPPTSLRLCYKCQSPLTSRINKRYYPILDAAKLIVSLSSHDSTIPSTIQYIVNARKLHANITFI